jgi:hypothetical protein
MKKSIAVILSMTLVITGFSQSEKFTKAMTANLAKMDSVKSPEERLAASASFERIGDAEKTQWLPYYYAAFNQITYALMKNDAGGMDAYADKADQLIAKADALVQNNSEISCLKSMSATLRMLVNPAQRWQQYATVIESELEKAKKQDPSNPRPYYLKAIGLRNTPEQFGGGCSTAKPVLEEALKKYEAFKPASEISPNWGKEQVQQTLEGCK